MEEKLLGKGHEIYENGLRLGYTTGSCATAAALSAAKMLMNDESDILKLETPSGITLILEVLNKKIEGEYAYSEIRKSSGDDPDVTDGILIGAKVRKRNDDNIVITGGEGVGTIKRKGLFGKVGEHAINPTPRKMIQDALKPFGGFDVEIYVPNGREIAKKTYNENMGIEGGISIIGTTGIVHPMSEKALLDTIKLELNMNKEEHGTDEIVLVPGSYGKDMLKKMNVEKPAVEMSNYVGDALKMALEDGFKKIILVGHIGKFSKLSIGIFNTHSNVSDTRMEAFVYYLFKMNAKREDILKICSQNTAEIAMNMAIDMGYSEVIKLMEKGAEERVRRYLKKSDLDVKVIIYSMERGVI